MDNQKSKHDTFNEHPVNPKILDILIQTNAKLRNTGENHENHLRRRS